MTAVELKQDKTSRHYKNHCRGNPDRIYKDRKQGNFKKPEITLDEIKEEMPIKSELDIKRDQKKEFIEMINKLIREKTMDIDTIYKNYGKQINEYKYIN